MVVHIYPPRLLLKGYEHDIMKLVSYGATPGQWKAWLQVPLEHAAARGNLDLVTKLLEAGAGEMASGWRGCRNRTVLDAAALGGNEKVVSTLLRYTKKARSDLLNMVSVPSGRSALYLAVVCGHGTVARELIRAGCDTNRRDPSDRCGPLHTAVADGHEELVRELLQAGACPNVRHGGEEAYTPLHIACSRGHIGMISALLASGADKNAPDNRGALPLHHAISQDHVAATESLLAAGANIATGGRFKPFFLAAIKGNIDILKMFLKHGMDVNARDDVGATALHAAALGDSSVSPSLSFSSRGARSATAIHTLIDAGAEPNVQRFDGGAPLHYAIAFANFHYLTGIMLALILRGARVDLPHSVTAQTPLHVACQHQKRGVDLAVDVLLRCGADETAVDGSGRTASKLLDVDLHGGKLVSPTNTRDRLRENLARPEEVERARVLLARAGQDRAWRRHCLPVMLRWRVERAKTTHTSCIGFVYGSSSCSDRATTSVQEADSATIESGSTGPAAAPNQGGVTGGTGAAAGIAVGSDTTASGINVANAGVGQPRSEEGGAESCIRGERGEGSGQEHICVIMAMLVEMAPAGVFRKVVGFL